LEERTKRLKDEALKLRLESERADITLSTRPERQGHIHPITQTMDEIAAIFAEMGFTLEEGPDIEDDFHNFTALNFPPGHPAREMHDTFYLPDDPEAEGEEAKKLLRTHTSTVQIRAMLNKKPPLKVLAMGRTYRSDYDITHTPMFHQCEGLVIDKNTHMGHLKGCLLEFAKKFFEVDELPMQFRPSFFPFTEPSAEVDIGCSRKDGGLTIGAGDSWLEVLGCGMVHPNVIKNCGLDPEEYQGFAFGLGIERLAMLKFGIPDLRTFFEGDVRWIDHYGFNPVERL
ncbi:MAG: phenylalanine--tRNA ligase subunit alpha, partial [Pseudomonadota bacterium]|nr:phenylalanine--tRNA ligase subunit alpha [Pseudomonadota bacterium]